jgi:hypothetical protein
VSGAEFQRYFFCRWYAGNVYNLFHGMPDFVFRIVRALSKSVSGISTQARALGKVIDMKPIPDAVTVQSHVITAVDVIVCSLSVVRMPNLHS